MDSNKKKIIIIAAVAGSLLVFSVSLIVIICLSKPACNWTANQPVTDIANLKPIASRQRDALVKAAFSVRQSSSVYMELKLSSIDEIKLEATKTILRMNFDCVIIDFDILYEKDISKSLIQKVERVILKFVGGVYDGVECQFSSFNFEDSRATRYYCDKNKMYNCHQETSGKIFYVNVDWLEFEVDGDPRIISGNMFSKQRSLKGC